MLPTGGQQRLVGKSGFIPGPHLHPHKATWSVRAAKGLHLREGYFCFKLCLFVVKYTTYKIDHLSYFYGLSSAVSNTVTLLCKLISRTLSILQNRNLPSLNNGPHPIQPRHWYHHSTFCICKFDCLESHMSGIVHNVSW